MIDFNVFLASRDHKIDTQVRAIEAWNRINDKPTTISIRRQGSDPGPQIVRIEQYSIAREDVGDLQVTGLQRAIAFGVRGHPDSTVTNTNIKRGDIFDYEGMEFEVVSIIPTIGEIQAVCEVRS